MRKKIFMSCLSLGLVGLMTSCSSSDAEENNPNDAGAKGQLVLNLASSNAYQVQTRALNEEDFGNTDKYTVDILNGSGVVYSCKGSDANEPISLTKGTYTVKAHFGKPEAASRDSFYVEGTSTVEVKAAQATSTEVTCTPQAGKVVVNFSKNMKNYYTDYYVAFSGTEALEDGNVLWNKDDKAPYYFQLTETGEDLTYTIQVATAEGYTTNAQSGATTGTVTQSFKIERNKSYNINVDVNCTKPGGVELDITIDETTNDIHTVITVPVEWTKEQTN